MEATLTQRTGPCKGCGCNVREIEPGLAVVEDTGTTADGLTFCPPDPDREPVGNHRL